MTFAFLVTPVVSGFSLNVALGCFHTRLTLRQKRSVSPCFTFSETPCVPAAISAAPRDVAILSSAGTIMQLGDSLSNRHTAPQAFAPTSVLAWAHTYREETLVCVCGREFGLLAVNSEMNPNSHHLTFHLSLYTHTHTWAGTHKRATLLARKQSTEWSAEGMKCSVSLCVCVWVRERRSVCGVLSAVWEVDPGQ